MKLKTVVSTIALLLSINAQAGGATVVSTTAASTCHVPSKTQVAALFTRWNNALKTLDPDKVAQTYRKDALLLPTLSNRPRHNHPEIRDYFVSFLAKKPVGIINESNIRTGCNMAIDGGIYTFKFADGSQVSGRYSYVYEYENGRWLISSHHSSAMPQDLKKEPWDQPWD